MDALINPSGVQIPMAYNHLFDTTNNKQTINITKQKKTKEKEENWKSSM